MRERVHLTRGWQYKEEGRETWQPACKVPGSIHTDLLHNGQITDPFVDLNELAVRWVAERDWWYRTTFSPDELCPRDGPGASQGRVELVFEGLDTFATVYLNNDKVLVTDNMFTSHRVDVTNLLRDCAGDVELKILFESALVRGRQLVKDHPEHNFLVRQTEAARLPIRKAQYHFGWDWGPILTTAGIWRPVYLDYYTARLDDVSCRYDLDEGLQKVSGKVCFIVAAASTVFSENLQVRSVLYGPGGENPVFQKDVRISREQGSETAQGVEGHITFELDNPQLWFPNTYGRPDQYTLKVTLFSNGEMVDLQTKHIGFRRCELIQEPCQSGVGSSFYFRVNDIDIFAGGSCWIPADNFLPRISPQRYRDWVHLMVQGNQTMVRIWGGGIYEDDSFFDACDELGLLVWHDFQFACGNYPTHDSFLSSVDAEARCNLRRLRDHPSLVIWAGNNEDYETVQERYKLDYNPDDKDPQSWLKSTFPARYIYESLLPKAVEEEHPGMIYLPSSPWSGNGESVKDRTVGDAHEWNLWHGSMVKIQDIDQIGGKFVSEFGMQSYPHMETLRRAISQPKELVVGSRVMEFHNKAIGHSWRMARYLHENFRLPDSNDLAAFAHLTQIMQAEAMRSAYKSWRRKWNEARECGGILVWQLNDCWPGVSWAVVDYHLVKKPAYYAISRALRSLDISISRSYNDWTHTTINPTLDVGHIDPTADRFDGGKMDVWISSCKTVNVNAEVDIRLISIRTGKDCSGSPTQTSAWIHLVQRNTVTDCGTHRLPVTKSPPEVDECDPYVVLATLRVDGQILADDIAWPQPIKYLDLSDRRVSVTFDGTKVVVSAENPVKGFVFDEVEGMSLSDNGFDVVPGLDRIVSVSVNTPASVSRLGYRYWTVYSRHLSATSRPRGLWDFVIVPG
ncbi:hypothetical protein KVR01_010854 [Diaporthe batatas]|uniref:uncharacterized protein n=1 Tax=Diaporthe batatas TaxID=748121 RepID=UPI001D057FE6|nr:uncharacterized protein KVR01_010854 [Diaporthe batatas]KAG8159193.1 hypothetical protein KVR01_010854 [Diaporthe batatas]